MVINPFEFHQEIIDYLLVLVVLDTVSLINNPLSLQRRCDLAHLLYCFLATLLSGVEVLQQGRLLKLIEFLKEQISKLAYQLNILCSTLL